MAYFVPSVFQPVHTLISGLVSTSPVQVMSIGEVIKPPQKYGLLSTNLVPFDR